MDRKDTDHGSPGGGGVGSPNASLKDAVAQIHAGLDALAAIDPATLSEFGLGEHAVDLMRARRRVDAAAAMVSARFSHGSEWSAYRQPEHCLAAQVSDSARAIRGQVLREEFLSQHFPLVQAAALAGDVSGEHVRALQEVHRKLPSLRQELTAAQESLVVIARNLAPKEFKAALLTLAHRADPAAVAADEALNERDIFLSIAEFGDGLWAIDGVLPKDLGAKFVTLLDAARKRVRRTDREAAREAGCPAPKASVDNLAALDLLLDTAAAVDGEAGLGKVQGARPNIQVLVPLGTLTAEEDADGVEPAWLEFSTGARQMLSKAYAEYLACDSVIEPVYIDAAGRVVATAKAKRNIPRWLRRAVKNRDRGCRFIGCPYRIDEVHHIEYFSRGGETSIFNTLGLCWFHHKQVHVGNITITGDPNGEVTFTLKDGRTYSSWPATGPP